METINMHCKSISQIQSGVYSGLKVISLVEHIKKKPYVMHERVSYLHVALLKTLQAL